MHVIFKQERIGFMDRKFYIYKFRTMDKNGNSNWLQRVLRRTGLDETAQILNLLKGDMVLIGPRPLTPQDHKKWRRFTLTIKPGLTGWWQIHGRNQRHIERLDLDYIYLKSKGFWFGVCVDLYIIWRTIPLVLFAKHG